MAQLVLPLVLLLALVELVVRVTAFVVLVVGTATLALWACSGHEREVADFLRPVCFDIARALVARGAA